MKKKGYAAGGMKKKGMARGGMKKKGMAKGGMKKGMAAGGAKLKMVTNKQGQRVPFYAADGKGKMNKGGMPKKKGMANGGAMKKKGMTRGGAMMKKKAYTKGGKVAMYNVGGMVRSSSELNTGIARPKNTYK